MLLLCLVRNLTLLSRLLNFVPPRYITVHVLWCCPLFLNPAPNCPLCREVLHSGVSTLDSRLLTNGRHLRYVVCFAIGTDHRPPPSFVMSRAARASRSAPRLATSDNFTCWLQRHPELRTPNSEPPNQTQTPRPTLLYVLSSVVSKPSRVSALLEPCLQSSTSGPSSVVRALA